jgi:ABC-type Na+ efflux pump permease subunit
MKEKIDNEFKPRTWLLGILIFIALVIVVILINKIVLVSKERKENSKSLFDIFDKTYNDIEDSKTKVDEEYQKQLEKHNIDSFNSKRSI